MKCFHCDAQIDRLYVQAPATVTTLQLVAAELCPDDLEIGNVFRTFHGDRIIKRFAFDGTIEVLDSNLGHADLEVDEEKAMFFCMSCDAEIPREQANEWMDLHDSREVESVPVPQGPEGHNKPF